MNCTSFSSVTVASRRILMVAGAALLSGAMAMAQQQPMGVPPASPSPANPTERNPGMTSTNQMQAQQNAAAGAMQDKAFARQALEGGMAEVQLGQLASQKSSSEDVKQFGQKMVRDHTQLNDQMKPIARKIGVRPPTHLSKKDQELFNKLQGMSGAEFDDAYIKAMVSDHRKDLSDFRQEADSTQNSDLKQAAQHGAQVISEHLRLAEKLAKDHNVKG